MAQEHGTLRQQLRTLESCIRDKDQELLTVYRHSTKHDQELLRHHDLLCEAEEATAMKARELMDFQAAKAQEIEDMQDEFMNVRRSYRSTRLSSRTETTRLLISRIRFTSFSCSRHPHSHLPHPKKIPLLLRISGTSRFFSYSMMYGRLVSILVGYT
jgi:hypothetical protein